MRVQLLHHSYERYGTPGDRTSLIAHIQGDVFECDGPELERLIDLNAVAEVDGAQQSKVAERTRADYELAIKRHDQAKAEHETLTEQPGQAPQAIERSAMNVEALRGERTRLGELARRADDRLQTDASEEAAAAKAAEAEAAAKKSPAK